LSLRFVNIFIMDYSDYIIYVDESGDHSLDSIDEAYPVFVLACCMVNKADYASNIIPEFQKFKFKHFGHDMVVLHAREIRKSEGDFVFLLNKESRELFHADLNALIDASHFSLVATAIEKMKYVRKFDVPRSPYTVALQFCLERAHDFLVKNKQKNKLTHIIVESREKKEDAELELAFHRIISNHFDRGMRHKRDYKFTPFNIRFAGKQANSTGMQLADMVVHPIGRHVIDPEQQNRAYDVIEGKLIEKPSGGVMGMGLKIFP